MKRTFLLMVSFVMIFMSFVDIETPVLAKTSGVWRYRIYDGKAVITACDPNGTVGETEVPDQLGGYPVTCIDDYAFENCKEITRIVIPKGVTEIGLYAFHDCVKLQGVVIPEGVISINGCAFENCRSLTAVTIPASVQIIWQPFSGCQNLTSIEVDPENPYYYSKGNCLIKTDGKTLVGGCKGSVIPEDDGILAIDDQAFYGQTGLTEIAIPNSVKTIGYSAFCECSSLKKVTIGKSVETIDPYAFYRCTNLAEITLPNSLKTMGEEAFSDCTALTEIVIPDSVTVIGEQAFRDCKKLGKITLPGGLTYLESETFTGTAFYQNAANWKNGVLYIGKYLVKNKEQERKTCIIKPGTRLIASGAFTEPYRLTELAVPVSLKIICY
ncbi:MAG: leucine-rich repeat domain-containing protein, partial [Clostridia bacterium]|nr:leucine-rich repeat domain-containing protein [Clostridia bacterium]